MNVFIITEGSAQTGYGHLTRCLSIYQGFEEHDITPTLVANCDGNGKNVLGNMLLQAFDWIENPDKLIEMISGADIAIIDSYLADLPIYESIHKSVKKTVYFDDTLRLDYPPGTIINGAVNAEFLPYATDDRHSYLLGLDYTPMRKAFWDIPERNRTGSILNVLVTMGATDVQGITFDLLESLVASISGIQFHVVLGQEDYCGAKRQKYRNESKISFYHSLDASEMCELMQKCEVAISAAGQTSYELARVGTKMILINVADNQRFNLAGWLSLGYIDKFVSSDDVTEMVNILQEYLDSGFKTSPKISGDGARDIVAAIMEDKVEAST